VRFGDDARCLAIVQRDWIRCPSKKSPQERKKGGDDRGIASLHREERALAPPPPPAHTGESKSFRPDLYDGKAVTFWERGKPNYLPSAAEGKGEEHRECALRYFQESVLPNL